jgi:haloacid dehalogenase-like hydrolase
LEVDEAIASRAQVDEHGAYTGVMEFYAYGDNKAVAMREIAEREGIDLAGSWAYSDSATDLPMLEAVGHPVVVNPDRELARVARERQWEVRKFERPVRLRDRVPTPPPAPTAVGATALVAGGLAAVWWRRRHAPPPPTKTEDLRRLAASLPRRLRVR